jgi:hypothetical protein
MGGMKKGVKKWGGLKKMRSIYNTLMELDYNIYIGLYTYKASSSSHYSICFFFFFFFFGAQ